MKVVILGGGIAGLACAHILIENQPNWDIHIHEREDDVGGQARSQKSQLCYTEYSWRIFGSTYHNIQYIIDKIGAKNNFRKMTDACIIKGADVNDGKLNVSNLLSQIVEYGDWITTIKLVHVITMCKERVITEYDDINALKYFNNNLIIKSIIGPFLGLDAERVSLSGFMKNIYSVCATDKKSFSPETTMLSKYPTQESLFIPWKKFLEDRGVKIYTKSALEQIKTNNNLISSVVMNNNNSIVADEYVFACSISPLIRAMQTNPYFISRPTFSNLVKLEQNLQLYFTMNLYLKEELGGTECTELVIVDAPWMPNIQKKRTWKDGGYLDKCANNIKDVWNIGLLDNIVGTLHKKILSKCSKEEAIEEGLYQLKQSEYIKKILAERGYESLDDVVVDTEVWYEFQNGPDGMLISTNPKFSLNVGNHKYIPKKVSLMICPRMHLSRVISSIVQKVVQVWKHRVKQV